MRCNHLRREHPLDFVACPNTRYSGQRIINSCFGRARLARVKTRIDDVGEHEIGEAWVGRTERGQEADYINVPHLDAKRLTRHRFHIYPRWFFALLANGHELPQFGFLMRW